MAEAEYVEILVGSGELGDIARKLLDAAENPEQVQTISVPTGFRVPRSVAEKAGFAAESGAVATVDAVAVEGYALAQVTGVQTETGAAGVAEAPAGLTGGAEPEGQAVTPEGLAPADTGPIGDTQVAAELERAGEPTDRVDHQPPLTGAENVTEDRDGGTLTTGTVTTTNLETASGGGTGQDPAEASPPGTITGSDVPTEPPTGGAPAARDVDQSQDVGQQQSDSGTDVSQGEDTPIFDQTSAQPRAESEYANLTPEQALELRGDSLDDALEFHGLSRTGIADEKRQRLADYLRSRG